MLKTINDVTKIENHSSFVWRDLKEVVEKMKSFIESSKLPKGESVDDLFYTHVLVEDEFEWRIEVLPVYTTSGADSYDMDAFYNWFNENVDDYIDEQYASNERFVKHVADYMYQNNLFDYKIVISYWENGVITNKNYYASDIDWLTDYQFFEEILFNWREFANEVCYEK
ncbi:MAG: hypothetical protein LBV67_08625 [Streptococcaceae bacterium]|jgi:hypothetical protein|nr:hypothetical protein [Streptococcaceae bacterium]